MNTTLLSVAYAPPVHYLCLLYHRTCLIEKFETFQKQSYRNRTVVIGPGGPEALVIPVADGSGQHTPITGVRLSQHDAWYKKHWHALSSYYGKSPFFEFYEDELRPFYTANPPGDGTLFTYNILLLQTLLRMMRLSIPLQFTTQYGEPDGENLTHLLQPKCRYSDPRFNPLPYYQTIRPAGGFIANASAFDLLFNMGPEAALVLRDSFSPAPQ